MRCRFYLFDLQLRLAGSFTLRCFAISLTQCIKDCLTPLALAFAPLNCSSRGAARRFACVFFFWQFGFGRFWMVLAPDRCDESSELEERHQSVSLSGAVRVSRASVPHPTARGFKRKHCSATGPLHLGNRSEKGGGT